MNAPIAFVTGTIRRSVEWNAPETLMRLSTYDNVKTTFPDFESFVSFYSTLLDCAKSRSSGELTLRIEPDFPTLEEGFTAYNFYDDVYSMPLLTVEIMEEEGAITLALSPF